MSEEVAVSPGVILEVLSNADAKVFIQRWLDIYARNRKGCRIKDYKWHIFSYGNYPSEKGQEALTAYQKQEASLYYVMDNDGVYVFTTDQRPEEVELSDYFVSPDDLSWTMAFTHEDGWLGPYFARHADYEILQKKQVEQAEKAKRIEHAKKMGWC